MIFTKKLQRANERLSGLYPSIYPSRQDANLVLSALRHQRDLFSGGPSLGIPDVNTHVGSVIHAFENLAYQRKLNEGAENSYGSKSSSGTSKNETIYKINLPAPPSASKDSRAIVRNRPKGKAPNVPLPGKTFSATTQTDKFSEDESNAVNSLNLGGPEFDTKNNPNKIPLLFPMSYKVLPPFKSDETYQPPNLLRPSKKNAAEDMQTTARTDVFLKPKRFSEEDVESDFLRGSTVSQSFIKNVVAKPRTFSTYEQNFMLNRDNGRPKDKINTKTRLKINQNKNDVDEVSLRYKEYRSKNDLRDPKTAQTFHPRQVDRAEI